MAGRSSGELLKRCVEVREITLRSATFASSPASGALSSIDAAPAGAGDAGSRTGSLSALRLPQLQAQIETLAAAQVPRILQTELVEELGAQQLAVELDQLGGLATELALHVAKQAPDFDSRNWGYAKLVDLVPDSFENWFNLGVAWQRLGKAKEAGSIAQGLNGS